MLNRDTSELKKKMSKYQINLFTKNNRIRLHDAKSAFNKALRGRHITFSPRDEEGGIKSELRDILDSLFFPLEENTLVFFRYNGQEEVIGFLIGKIQDKDLWQLAYLYIDPLYRSSKAGGVYSCGAGSQLYECFEDMAKESGAKKIFALTWDGVNPETLNWYIEKKNFVENKDKTKKFSIPGISFFSKRTKDGKWINEKEDAGSEPYGYIYSREYNDKEYVKKLKVLKKYSLEISLNRENQQVYNLLTLEKSLINNK